MASRLARSAAGAPFLRPAVARRALPALASTASVRYASNVPAEEPKKMAQSIVEALPGNNFITKSAFLSGAAGLGVWAISNEIYVVNEETVVAVCLLAVWTGVIKYGSPMFQEWAAGHNNRIRNILNSARADHAEAVKTRISDVGQMSSVVEITKGLFEVSKETAKLESQAFELEQKTAIAAEAKAVLDSWVRYESQVKQRQQKELAQSIIAKVQKELENPKVLQQILQQSVAEVEKIVSSKAQ